MATFVRICKMAVSRRLGFLKFEICTIRSANPEDSTLEINIMSIMYKVFPGIDLQLCSITFV